VARQFIYHMAGLNKAYGTKKVLENVHLSFYPDAKIGILGPNGAGKSTILKIMAGLDKEWSGEAWLAEGATVGYLAQEPALDANKTVFENIMEGVAAKTAIIERYNELMMNYSDETADESAKLQDEMDRLNLWDLEQQVEMAMEALGCPPKDSEVTKLSGGERRMCGIGRGLMAGGEVLMLDEPSLGLAPIVIEQIYEVIFNLRREGRTILLVEENAERIAEHADMIHLLDNGRIAWSGLGAELMARPEIVETYLGV